MRWSESGGRGAAHLGLVNAMRALFPTALLLFAGAAAFGGDRKPSAPPSISITDLSNFQLRELTTWMPRLEYPAAARQQRIGGRGVFRLHVQLHNGVVARVEVASSTGSPILDRSTVDTFKRWRFKPPILRQYQRRHYPTDMSEELVFTAPVAYVPPN